MTRKKDIENIIKSGFGVKYAPDIFQMWIDESFELAKELEPDEFKESRVMKRLREEILPISIYIKTDPEIILIEHIDGNQNYDAVASTTSGTFPIEVTCTKDGEFEKWMFDHQKMFGGAPLTGVTTANLRNAVQTGTELFAEVECAVNSKEILQREIAERIKDKCTKSYSQDTVLVLAVDDGIIYGDAEWNIFVQGIIINQDTFKEVFLIGYVNKKCSRLN